MTLPCFHELEILQGILQFRQESHGMNRLGRGKDTHGHQGVATQQQNAHEEGNNFNISEKDDRTIDCQIARYSAIQYTS